MASLAAGPLLALACWLALPHAYEDAAGKAIALSPAARATIAMLAWMAVWWMTEAVPLAATSLLPAATFPLLGIAKPTAALSPYASDVIFLFLGGFLLAAAMTRWGLDRRIAFATLRLVGTSRDRLLAGVMIATAFVSMWVSNTAAAAMMVPIALSLIRLAGEGEPGANPAGPGGQPAGRFAVPALLAVAYGASIGGVATLVGSPPNGIAARFVAQAGGPELSFARWIPIGLPLTVLMLLAAWLLLAKVLFRQPREAVAGGGRLIEASARDLGPWSRGEIATLAAFGLAVGLWLSRPLLAQWELGGTRPLAGLGDAGIALIAALLLFVWPMERRRGGFVLDWKVAPELPWGVLLLFGGGLSLAAAIEANGVTAFVAAGTQGLRDAPAWASVTAIVGASVFVSEVTSNTAQVAATAPLLVGIAPSLGVDASHLVVASALAASCAFMMPVGTPPNAIVFGTGHLTIGQMCRAGLWLNLTSVATISVYALWWLPLVLP
jgi:sodium-dependent dicarboxylate transporter 2/3/5